MALYFYRPTFAIPCCESDFRSCDIEPGAGRVFLFQKLFFLSIKIGIFYK